MYQPAQSRIYISRLLICEVLGHHNQYLRPYQAHVDRESLNHMKNYLDNPGNVTPIGLSSLPTPFITPSATPGAKVDIINGWNEKRFRFMMEVVFDNDFQKRSEIICGFTDYPGISHGNHLDPNMVFYINSIVPMRHNIVSYAHGNMEMSIPYSPAQMISKENYSNLSGNMYNMTPVSLINRLTTDAWQFSGEVHDLSSDVSYPSLSLRNYTNPGRYASKILNSFKDYGVNTNMGVERDSEANVLSTIRGELLESSPSTNQNTFINLIRNITQNGLGTAFTFGDLMRIDSRVTQDDVTKVFLKQPTINAFDTEHLAGARIETQTAITISNVLPTIMMDYGIVSLSFTSTNNTIGVQRITTITNIHTMSGSQNDLSPYIQTIVNRIDQEIMSAISQQNMINYDIEVQCDLIGDTILFVTMGGSNIKYPYVVPTFADSLFSPVLTSNVQDLDTLAQGVRTVAGLMVDALPERTYHNHTHNPTPLYAPTPAYDL